MSAPIDERAGAITAATLDARLLADGGAGAGSADLWATYAAVRTLRWVGHLPSGVAREETVASLLGRQNANGGFAWQRGLASDVLATFYSAQCLSDLACPFDVQPMLDWLSTTQGADGGFGMQPGQTGDVWASYYAARLFRELGSRDVPDRGAFADWLARLQCADGGVTWSPDRNDADVRAAYYAVHAALAGGLITGLWDVGALRAWLQDMQDDCGGFRFDRDGTACLWATFRAVKALEALSAQPANPATCIAWIRDRLGDGGFIRWADYSRSDVWANFTAVGALIALGSPPDAREKTLVVEGFERCRIVEGGYTYCDSSRASDALSTASLLIAGWLTGRVDGGTTTGLLEWLQAAHMPWEDGVMYMPGRGAEIRCTLWALAAQRLLDAPIAGVDRLVRWLAHLQNPDGGFGYWLGRGSDLASTVAALAILNLLNRPIGEVVRVDRLADFLGSCTTDRGVASVPGGQASVTAAAQAIFGWTTLGRPVRAESLVALLRGHELLSGYCDQAGQPPNLYTTYQCCLAFDALGSSHPYPRLSRFLERLVSPDGRIGWTIFGSDKQDPLVLAFYTMLARKAADPMFTLPVVVL
jgi:prenyltransferase beta subunit